MAANQLHAIPNTHRKIALGAREIGPVPRDERVEVSVYVRRNPSVTSLSSAKLSTEIEEAFGASPQDIARIEKFAKTSRLDVIGSSPVRRSVFLAGTARDMASAFGTTLRYYEYPYGNYRGRVGSVHVPAELDGVIEAVFGLDNRRVGRSYIRHVSYGSQSAENFAGRDVLPRYGYFPPELATLYSFPSGFNGGGQNIGILAFNDTHHGGYSLEALRNYFQRLQIPLPEIVDMVVHGQGNDPGDDGPVGDRQGDSSGEIMLDMQMAGTLAPGAGITMYFTSFTERGWVDAIYAAVTDAENNPSILSISYGNPEDTMGSAWTLAAVLKINEAFQMASIKGLTICCASGDQGSSDIDVVSRATNVDFPASSPFVLGCGGTRLLSYAGVVTSETVWNDGPDQNGGLSATGGGVSKIFQLPAYQQRANVPPLEDGSHSVGRGVPDVAGLADPETPVIIIRLDGAHLTEVGGTSATAPLWAALFARINQALGRRIGFFNPVLYTRCAVGVLNDITLGNNGSYRALPGWDACTGLGSPNGVRLLRALSDFAAPLESYENPADISHTGASFFCCCCGRTLPASVLGTSPSLWVFAPYQIAVCDACWAIRCNIST
jgi:kumamolisin